MKTSLSLLRSGPIACYEFLRCREKNWARARAAPRAARTHIACRLRPCRLGARLGASKLRPLLIFWVRREAGSPVWSAALSVRSGRKWVSLRVHYVASVSSGFGSRNNWRPNSEFGTIGGRRPGAGDIVLSPPTNEVRVALAGQKPPSDLPACSEQ